MDCLKIATSLKEKTRYFSIMSIYYTTFFHTRLQEYKILSDAFEFRLCENEIWCLYTIYQMSMQMSIYDNEILTLSRIDLSMLSKFQLCMF